LLSTNAAGATLPALAELPKEKEKEKRQAQSLRVPHAPNIY
jgi:hypothetical protein